MTPTLLPDEPPPAGAKSEFKTGFSKHSVAYSEILSGGPPKDGIPAIDSPRFVAVDEANKWVNDREPVEGQTAHSYRIHQSFLVFLGGV